jgi:WD40 repeat protein
MADPSPQRVEELFDQAIDLDPARRAAFLDEQCAGDAGLRAAVEKLLQFDSKAQAAESLLRSPLARTRPRVLAPPPPLPPAIARYRIVRVLGEGGMGTVYEAEQDNPRRTVALKVLRVGRDSDLLLQRFAREAQILGRLQHPGIAQVYDAGVSETGQPYFAMELIVGVPLDQFAGEQALDTRGRLELFARVCDAVQHAHERGIIHRDLKPPNILVEASGQPRVLDFGVARAAPSGLTAGGGRTETGQLIGTLNYMSPEQASADPAAIDARADVYALGVVLYEMLAHRLPYSLDGLPLPEAVRVIREQEPSRLGSLDGRLRGDVETIVAKALEKDRARRYSSAGELAADIRRHLSHEPIRARPPSALYQLRKFARRHKAVVGGVVGVIAALTLGLIGTVLFAVREAEQRGRAESSARVANQEKQAALYQAYRARIAAAVAALLNHDVADAARHLDDEATAPLRDWEWRHLHSRLDDSAAVVEAPVGGAVFLLGGPHGPRIGTVGSTGIRLADLDGRQLRQHSRRPWPPVHVTAHQTPRGLWVVHKAEDGVGVVLTDEEGNARLRLAPPAGGWADAAAFSPDGARVAVAWRHARGSGSLTLHDTSSGRECTRSARRHRDRIGALAFSPDGTRLASASDDFTARVWDVATGAQTAVLEGHTSKVLGVAFSPGGARVVTTSADGTVRQWRRTGEPVGPPYERHAGEVIAATYSPDGQWVASAGTDRTIRVWRANPAAPAGVRQEAAVLHGHRGTVTGLAFAGDGRRLCSVSEDGTVRTWDTDPRASLPVLRGHTSYVYSVAYSHDGRWIASGGWDGRVRLWDALTGEPGPVLRLGNNVRALAFGPDGSWLITGCDHDGRLQFWDVATGRLRRALDGTGNLAAVSVSPDGTRVAATTCEGQVRVCAVADGRDVFRLDHKKEVTRGVAFSPDGRWLASTGADLKTVCLWDAQTYQLAAQFAGHTDIVHVVAFSPDGRLLVSAGKDRVVRMWDVRTGHCRAELHGHTDAVLAAAFHKGGTRLATAGHDRAVWLWDLDSGEKVARLPGHTNYVGSLAFSPDGKTLVSSSGDRTLRLWDTEPLRTRSQARLAAQSRRPKAD